MLVIFDKKTRDGNGKSLKEYLEKGTNNDRDIKDKRYTLHGDLDTFQKTVEIGEKKGYKETYRSIVLSFGEDYIKKETLQDITDDFIEQYTAGYKSDDYVAYAEAHLPKIKLKKDNSTRKPHIHIVFAIYSPTLRKSLNLGNHSQRLKEIELLKKVTENKYGLFITNQKALANENKKQGSKSFEEKKERVKYYNDLIKENIEDIENLKDLKRFLKENIEDIKTIKQSTKKAKTPYITIELKNGTKDRLKGSLFDDEKFLSAKNELLSTLTSARGEKKYYEVGKPRKNKREDILQLQAYFEKRAEYINKRLKRKIKLNDEKTPVNKNIINYKVKDKKTDNKNLSELQTLSSIDRLKTSTKKVDFERLRRVKKSENDSNNYLNSLKKEVKEDIQMKKDIDVKALKKNLNPKFVFDNLNIDRNKYFFYKLKKGKNAGEWRIKASSRHLNTSDFLTKEVNLRWLEAKELMQKAYNQQKIYNSKLEEQQAQKENDYISYQDKIFFETYKKKIDSDLKGFFIDNKEKENVKIISKQKDINIEDKGNKLVSRGKNKQEEIKLMLDIAEAKNWNLATLNVRGSEAFKKEVQKQIQERMELSKQQLQLQQQQIKDFVLKSKNEDFEKFLDGKEWKELKHKSTRNYPVYENSNTGEKILITRNKDGVNRYQNLNNNEDRGTIIDFMKNRGLNSYEQQAEYLREPKAKLEYTKVSRSDIEQSQQQAREELKDFKKLERFNKYLSEERKIDKDIYTSYQNLKTDKKDNVVIPLYQEIDKDKFKDVEFKDDIEVEVGYAKRLNTQIKAENGKEIKELISGSKGIGVAMPKDEVKNVVICENMIDGMSYIQLNALKAKNTLIISTQGTMTAKQEQDIAKLCNSRYKSVKTIIATDNDKAGKKYAEQLKEKLEQAQIHQSTQKDWNEELQKQKAKSRKKEKYK